LPIRESKKCARTGLIVTRPPATPLWRVAKVSYGPLNPPRRTTSGRRGTWGRYDVADHRTIYAASPEVAAYGETLATLRPGMAEIDLEQIFEPGKTERHTSIMDAVKAEWESRNHQPPGMVPAGWRLDRLMHRITLDQNAWFIDIEAAESVSVLRRAVGPQLVRFGVEDFTVETLRGTNREATTRVAQFLWHTVLDDGSLPGGIRYFSKHGSDWECWAAWLRQTDDGLHEHEATRADHGSFIDLPLRNDALREVCAMFSLTGM
jgi:hypothetical protein